MYSKLNEEEEERLVRTEIIFFMYSTHETLFASWYGSTCCLPYFVISRRVEQACISGCFPLTI